MSKIFNKQKMKIINSVRVSHFENRRWYVKKLDHEKINELQYPYSELDEYVSDQQSVNKIENISHSENFNLVSERNKSIEIKKQISENDKSDFRVNDLNIQMLSRSLYDQLFNKSKTNYEKKNDLIELSLSELKKHGLPGPLQKIPDVDIALPEIYNKDLEYHFFELGRQQSEPYKKLVNHLVDAIPRTPESWNFSPGWTKYVDGNQSVVVDFPDDDALIFDVEVCCKEGQHPVLATAVSNNYWYSWVSKDLYNETKGIKKRKVHNYLTDELIPLETSPKCKSSNLGDSFLKPRLVVGHNVSFDRARIKEQYWMNRTGLRFLDTMSLHISISGVTSHQKIMLKSGTAGHQEWAEYTSLNNSLNEIYKFYCNSELKKEERNIFVEGELKDIKDNFQNLVTYCAKDVVATHKILTFLWPLFSERFPHPVTFAGMLELSICYLPVNHNWKRYLEDSQQTFDDHNMEAKFLLSQQADKSCQLFHNGKYKENLWLWDQNWDKKLLKLKKIKPLTKKELKTKVEREMNESEKGEKFNLILNNETDEFDREKINNLEEHFSSLLSSKERLPMKIPYLAGYPEWYRKLCTAPGADDWKPGPELISTSMKTIPKLLSLTWNFMPIHHLREHGWCFIMPYQTRITFPDQQMKIFPFKKFIEYYLRMKKKKCTIQNHEMKIDETELCKILQNYLHNNDNEKTHSQNIKCGLIKLPHKDGDELNVGNPLARDFINKFSDLEISGSNQNTIRMIKINRQLSYWKNNRNRIENQFIVWLKGKELPNSLRSSNCGAILPTVIVTGTLTRRAVESTWMTAANAVDERIGSELRSMIQAPNGYSIVGADVDSQELWIAALFGDAYFAKEHGCTAFGWMTLSGQKSDGTDMHSMTAKTMGISRSDAKVINYGRIYGAGQKFAEKLIKQFSPGISAKDATSKSKNMFQTTKGKKLFRLKNGFLKTGTKKEYSRTAAKQLCIAYSKSFEEIFERPRWIGGSESAMFNRLEEIACSAAPATPFLSSRLSKAIEPYSSDDYNLMPTRINWVVQSSAVDFLHLMLVCMRWLIGPHIRFCLSFHDEVRYLVPDKEKYQIALALHVTNLLVRSFCVKRVGMNDLPQSVAFFSSVEVDSVLRKEGSHECVTPSNSHGLSKGYGIPPGESLDILKSIEKADGKIGIHKIKIKKNKI